MPFEPKVVVYRGTRIVRRAEKVAGIPGKDGLYPVRPGPEKMR